MQKVLQILILLFPFFSLAQPKHPDIVKILDGHLDDMESLALSVDGKYIVSGSWNGQVNVYTNDSNYFPLYKFNDHSTAVNSIAFNKKSNIFVTCGNDAKIMIYKVDSLGNIALSKNIWVYKSAVNIVISDALGKFIYTGGADGQILIYDIAKAKERKIANGSSVHALALTSDKKWLFCGDMTGQIKKYDNTTSTISSSLAGHSDQINALIISADGKYLYSASNDKTIIQWDIISGKVLKTFKGHDWKVICIALSTDGKYLVSGSNDGTSIFWDIEKNSIIKKYEGIGTSVKSIALSKDNSKIYQAIHYQNDSSTERGVIVLKTGIIPPKKSEPKPKPGSPTTPKTTPNKPEVNKTETKSSEEKIDTEKKVIKKTNEIEISEEKKKKK